MKYSVLLLLPDYKAENYGEDTFYTFVEAQNPMHAVSIAQHECIRLNEWQEDIDELDDLWPLLVTKGHNYGLAFSI